MIKKLKKFSAAVMAAALALTLAGCGKQNEYERLKEDIVGVWCDIEGPEYVENGGNPYYKLYEFTSDGQIIYHTPMEMGSVYNDSTYELRDNYLMTDGAMCIVDVQNDVLTMTTDNGESKYRRMTMQEVCNFGVYYLDPYNYQEQLDFMGILYGTDANGSDLSPYYETDENGSRVRITGEDGKPVPRSDVNINPDMEEQTEETTAPQAEE